MSPSTIKRWVDAGALSATRTVGKHRLISRSEALRFAREQGLSFDDSGLPAGSRMKILTEGVVDRLAGVLRRGRAVEGRELIFEAYGAVGAVALADDLIQPVMERLGHDWETDAIDVFQEHRASRVVKLALGELIHRLQQRNPPAPGDPLAIGAAPEADPYMIPGLLCELTLRERGWEVMNLGVNLPLPSLGRAVLAHRPALVWLSVSVLEDPAAFLRQFADFSSKVQATGASVILGGQALTADLRRQLPEVHLGNRMADLDEFARRLRSGSDPSGRMRSNDPEPA